MGVELSIYSIEERLAIANKKNPSSIPSWLGLRASNT
jgi:ribosomal protein L39E